MEQLLSKFKEYVIKKKNPKISIVAKELDIQEYEVYGLVEMLKKQGYLFDIIDNRIKKVKPIKENDIYEVKSNLDHLKFLMISDTHLASKYDRVDILRYLYQEAEDKGVNYILHSGDLTEGLSGRPQQQFELKELSYTGQRDYVIDKYPESNIPTYMISGNHDLWWVKQCGADIVNDICKQRDDLIYLGSDCEDLKIGKLKIRLYHGKGGQAYAKCFDDKTEILTENGWKLFKDLEKEEKVATLNIEKDNFEWQLPTDYINQHYEGEMYHFKSRTIDMMVTPNHRMLVKRYDKNILQNRKQNLIMPKKSHRRINLDWQIKEAKELENTRRQEWQFKRGGQSWIGKKTKYIKIPKRKPKKFASTKIRHIGKIKIEDIAELMAWYVTEGYANDNVVSICQSKRVNPENYKKIINLCKRIGFKNIKGTGRDDKDINMYSVELAEYMIKECGKGSYNKYLPKWLKEQPSSVLKIVFDTMIAGDGWNVGKESYGYKSYSKRLLDDMSEIAHKLGYGVSKNKDTISISGIQNYPTINKKPEKIKYSGNIYCVSVPNTIILVRRNGKTCWSGNSYKLQKYLDTIPLEERPHILQTGHIHQAFYMKQDKTHCFQTSCLQDLTPYERSQGFNNDKSVWWTDVYMDNKGNPVKIEQELETFNKVKRYKR